MSSRPSREPDIQILPGYVPREGGGLFAALEAPRRTSVKSLTSADRTPSESSDGSGPPDWLQAARLDEGTVPAAESEEVQGNTSGRRRASQTEQADKSSRTRPEPSGSKSASQSKSSKWGRKAGISSLNASGPSTSVVPLQPTMQRQDSRSSGSSSGRTRSSGSGSSRNSDMMEGPMGIASTKRSEMVRVPSGDDSDSEGDPTARLTKAASRAAQKILGQTFVDGVGRRLSWLSMSPRLDSELGSVATIKAEPTALQKATERCTAAFEPMRQRLQPHCRKVLKSRCFSITMVFALVLALFLKDFWIATDIDSNAVLDAFLTVVLLLFVTEWFMEVMSWPSYNPKNLFFWMDLLGAGSLILDITYFGLDLQAGSTDSAVVLRAARVLKLSARAGRFVRVVRLLRFVPGWAQAATQNPDSLSTQAISSRLVAALAARTSLLIILVVVVLVPLVDVGSYPGEVDRSMEAWIEAIDSTLHSRPDLLSSHLEGMDDFYSDLNHFPYALEIIGEVANFSSTDLQSWMGSRGAPKRQANRLRIEKGNIRCDFNLSATNRIEAMVSIVLMVVIIASLLSYSAFLNGAVAVAVAKPLERLLVHVRRICTLIFEAASELAYAIRDKQEEGDDHLSEPSEQEDEPSTAIFVHEHDLLSRVAEKLAIIKEILVSRSAVDAAMEHLDHTDRQMINAFQGTKEQDRRMMMRKADSFDKMEDEELFEQRLELNKKRLEEAVLDFELLNSWNFNPLELDQERNHAACEYFMGSHNHGLEVNEDILRRFLVAIEEHYLPTCAYHNWFHAVDVMHCVYRYMHICSTHLFLNSQQRYAMLVCALAHDLNHPGLSNNFLIETSHELALRYNDKSPLEHMHSAMLWELASQEGLQIFHPIAQEHLRDIRKMCIEMILHTDSVLHFAMIKELQLFRGVNNEIFDDAYALHQQDPDEYPSMGVVNCLRNPEARLLFMKSILHTADLSNSMKPFRICRVWSWQLLEEGFIQGDIERELGVPIQALNNRDQVNRAFSQVNFIEFLVAPLLLVMVKFVPPIEDGAMQALQNTRTWYRVWVSDTKPFPTDHEKKALLDRITRLELRFRLDALQP
mmetsp:Transcript_1362/g.3657  ORF Transcript_1362/g.3657 Transcript_1362/m.3657 type:complete len:1087 (-) Transcript_1362:78-3338(-)